MTVQSLIDKLKERPASVDELRLEKLDDFQREVGKLYATIEEWLRPAVLAGVLSVTRGEASIREEGLAPYFAEMLSISDGKITVRLEPIGSRVTDVVASGRKRYLELRGRVDMVCGPMRIPLVRDRQGVWMALPLRGEAANLDEEAFAEILSEMLLDE